MALNLGPFEASAMPRSRTAHYVNANCTAIAKKSPRRLLSFLDVGILFSVRTLRHLHNLKVDAMSALEQKKTLSVI